MRYTVLIFLFLSINSCHPTIYDITTDPTTIFERSYYRKDLNNIFDVVTGNWNINQGTMNLNFSFEKREMTSGITDNGQYDDLIVGNYSYTENGNIISETNDTGDWKNYRTTLIFQSNSEYYMILRDVVSERTYTGTFQLLSSTTAKVTLYPIQGTLINMNYNGDFRLPTSFILSKM